MQVSYVMKSYRELILQAFKEFVLAVRFVPDNPFPNMERYKQFYSRLKDTNVDLRDVMRCEKGLPEDHCYIQFTRSALQFDADQDEFRDFKVRTTSPNRKNFTELRFGYGFIDLNFYLFANNASTLESCESFFYRRLYKIRTFKILYLDIEFNLEVLHEPLTNFSLIPLEGDQASGFSVQWVSRVLVPILMKDLEGFDVIKTELDIYNNEDQRPAVFLPGERTEFQNEPLDKTHLIEIVQIQDGNIISEIDL